MPSDLLKLFLKLIAVFVICFLAVSSLASQVVKPLPMIVGGRVAITNENNRAQYIYSWPGTYFEASFTGASVDIHLDDSVNMLHIVVDKKAPIVLNKPGKINYSLKNLGEGIHKVRVEKRTESYSRTATFHGFFIPESQKVLTTEKPKRKIEFIGDSFTLGYGNTSTSRQCSNEQVFLTTDTQVAFGSLVAKHFNAQYQINAFSGQGIVRNYKGSDPETSLILKYPYVFNYGDIVYKDDWSPQIIAIILGTNDFNTPLEPHERWKTRETLQKDFVATYEKFVLSLRKQHPTANIFLVSPDNSTSEVTAQISRVADNLKIKGEHKVLLQVTDITLGLTGCAWHASVEDHKKVASLFIDFLEKNPSLWE
ncbi:MAG: SGNH/GDSL hydrolase family protein [Pseudomonadota bacterium]